MVLIVHELERCCRTEGTRDFQPVPTAERENEITSIIIAAFHAVYNRLGFGFLENIYVAAIVHELVKRGLRVATEVPTIVYYDGVPVGAYRVDLIVEGCIVVEVKATTNISDAAVRQLMNYIRCTDLENGLLLAFGDKPLVRRVTMRNGCKPHVATMK